MLRRFALLGGVVGLFVVAALLMSAGDTSAAGETKPMVFSGTHNDEIELFEEFCDGCIPDDLLGTVDDLCLGCIDDNLIGGVHRLRVDAQINIAIDLKGTTSLKLTLPEGPLNQGSDIPIPMELTATNADGTEFKLDANPKITFEWEQDGDENTPPDGDFEDTVVEFTIGPTFTLIDKDLTPLHNGQEATLEGQVDSPEIIDPCQDVTGVFECALKIGFETTAEITGNGITADSALEIKGGETIPAGTIDFPKGPVTQLLTIPCDAPASSFANLALTDKTYGVDVHAFGHILALVNLNIKAVPDPLPQLEFDLNEIFNLPDIPVFDGKVSVGGPADNSRSLGQISKDKEQPVIKSVDIVPTISEEGKPTRFTATANDNCNSGADLSYVWNFSDGGTAYGASVQHVFDDAGSYSGNVTVSDKAGNQDTRDFSVTVDEGSVTNIKYEGPISMGPQTDDEIELSAVLLDQTGDPIKGRLLTFSIDEDLDCNAPLVEAANITDVNGRARVSLRPNLPPGSYGVCVSFAGDGPGQGFQFQASEFRKKFTVFTNRPPTVSPLADPGKEVWGVPIEFSGFATDPDGGAQDTIKYLWDFGDGTSAINPKVSHAYDKPGEYEVSLTVTDKDGAVSEVTTTVEINKRDTAIKNCGDVQVPNGQRTVNDCARLIDSEGEKVIDRTIVFTMTIQGTDITNSGLTDANGELRTAVNRNQPAGCFAASIVFDGSADNLYESARYTYFFYTSGNGGPQNCTFVPAGGAAGYDVNCDGSANSIDALYILQVVAGLTSFVSCENVANVNGDGVIDVLDALKLLQHSAGL